MKTARKVGRALLNDLAGRAAAGQHKGPGDL